MHVHLDESIPHDDCKICLIVKNLSSGDAPSFEILAPLEFIDSHVVVVKKSHIVTTITKGYFSHAPPHLS